MEQTNKEATAKYNDSLEQRGKRLTAAEWLKINQKGKIAGVDGQDYKENSPSFWLRAVITETVEANRQQGLALRIRLE